MMLVLPVEEVGSPYNGSIRAAPAVGAKTLSDVPAAVLA
jgi:hypothetical protein